MKKEREEREREGKERRVGTSWVSTAVVVPVTE
jgi:hypothetical protein